MIEFFTKVYHRNDYNCFHFAIDFLNSEGYEDTAKKLESTKNSGLFENFRKFEKLASPYKGCVVLMRNPKGPAHIGVYYSSGLVIQFSEKGTSCLPLALATKDFKKVEFYK